MPWDSARPQVLLLGGDMCCIDCKDRCPGCHSLCEKYITEIAKRKERSNTIYKAKITEKAADSVRIKHAIRMKERLS